MYCLVRALMTAALAVVFFNLGSAVTASDPVPAVNRPTQKARTGAAAFMATAYCQRGTTRSGVNTHPGIVAADPRLLPVGSVVHVETNERRYNGVYTVLDTGSKVQGRHVDLFMHDCREAQHFGTQRARVTVLRRGWSPGGSASAPPLRK